MAIYVESLGEPLHPDFQKILKQFQWRYGVDQGTDYFKRWVNKLGLNPDKPYGWGESFSWLEPSDFRMVKQDKHAKYYEVETAFPLTSMNMNIYKRAQLVSATSGLAGQPVNLNHDHRKMLPLVEIKKAKFADNASQLLLRVDNKAGSHLGLNIQEMIDAEEIIHTSLEADCPGGKVRTSMGKACIGFEYSGMALLEKRVLPGIPLSRIMPLEAAVEMAEALRTEAKWTRAYINSLPNSSFAVIEPDYLNGKTDNKNARHLPYRDKDGRIDLRHLANAMARMNQIVAVTQSISTADLRRRARNRLIPLARKYLPGSQWARGEFVTVKGVMKLKKEEAPAKAGSHATEDVSTARTIAKLKLKVSDLERLNRKLVEDVKAGESKLEAKEDALQRIEQRADKAERDLEEFEGKLATAKQLHGDVVADLTKTTAELTETRKDFEKLDSEHSDLVKSAENIKALLKEETEGHRREAEDNIRLTEKLTERNNEIVNLGREFQIKFDERETELTEQLTERINEISNMKKEFQIKFNQMDSQLQKCRSDYKKLEEKYHKARRRARLTLKSF